MVIEKQKQTSDASINDILSYLKSFKEDMKMTSEATNKNLSETNSNIRLLDSKIEAIKLDIDDKAKKTDDKFHILGKKT